MNSAVQHLINLDLEIKATKKQIKALSEMHQYKLKSKKQFKLKYSALKIQFYRTINLISNNTVIPEQKKLTVGNYFSTLNKELS